MQEGRKGGRRVLKAQGRCWWANAEASEREERRAGAGGVARRGTARLLLGQCLVAAGRVLVGGSGALTEKLNGKARTPKS